MKRLKLAGIVAGALAVVVLVAFALALSSGVQTWAVRRAVAGQPGLTIEVGSVSAGPSAAEVSGLRVVRDGLVVSAATITTRHSAWAYLTASRVDVDELVIKDLAVEVKAPSASAGAPGPATATAAPSPPAQGASAPTPPAPAPAAGEAVARQVFEGLLKQARLPLDLRVGKVTVEGKATLPDRQNVVFSLRATGLEVGQRGKIEWTVDFADARADAPLRALRSTGTLQVRLVADRRIDQIELESISAAMGPNLPKDQVRLHAQAEQTASGGDETYVLDVGLIRSGKLESLLNAKAAFTAARREIAGTWEIALRSEQLAALLAGFGLPEIAANGAGKFSVQPGANAAAASGRIQASASQLGKLSPALSALSAVRLVSTFDGAVRDNKADLNAFELEVSESGGRPFARLQLLQQASYRLEDRRVTLANPKGEAARLTLDAVPLAWAQPVARPLILEQGTLSLALAVEGEPDGSRIRVRAVEPLALRGVTVRDAQKKALVENASLSLRPTLDYSTTRLTAQLSELQLAIAGGDSLGGTISAEVTQLPNKPATAFRAALQARLPTLLRPFLQFDPGPLGAAVEIEGRHEADTLQVAKASVTVTREGGALLAAIDAPQVIRANLKAATFAAANPAATAARLRLGEIPLAWAEPYVARSKLSGTFAGATIEVTMRTPEDLALTTTAPILLRGVTAALDGKPQVQGVDLSLDVAASKKQDRIGYEVRALELKQGATRLARIGVSGEAVLGTKFAATAKGSLEVDAPALLAQPALAEYATLAQGRLTTTFEGALGDTTQVKAVVAAKNLVAKAGNRALGDVDFSLTATLKADGGGSVALPLTVVNAGRKSDLALDGSFGKAADQTTWVFNGKAASTNLVVDDLQALAALAPAKPAETAKPAAAPAPRPSAPTPTRPAPAVAGGAPARDAKPFWQGVTGRAELDLKRILYGQDYTIRGIRGLATITPTRLALDNLEGSFRDRPFKLGATVTFAATQPQPYTLAGLVDVTGVDVGELLRATNPQEKPMLESTVKVAAKLTGQGATLPGLLERTYGTFDVSGGKGVLRALGRKGETVGTASALLGLAGAIAGSSNTVALGRLGQELEEMQFDTFALKVERDAALNLKFSTIEFLSPNKRLVGTGSMNFVQGATFDNWPFQFEFRLAGKDFMAQLLDEARVLSGQKDEKGYYPMAVSFPVSGTANKVSNGLWKILAGTAARAGLEGLLRR
jgi:hypothetical protein